MYQQIQTCPRCPCRTRHRNFCLPRCWCDPMDYNKALTKCAPRTCSERAVRSTSIEVPWGQSGRASGRHRACEGSSSSTCRCSDRRHLDTRRGREHSQKKELLFQVPAFFFSILDTEKKKRINIINRYTTPLASSVAAAGAAALNPPHHTLK